MKPRPSQKSGNVSVCEQQINDLTMFFRFAPQGIEARVKGRSKWELVTWGELARMARPQPELFKEVA